MGGKKGRELALWVCNMTKKKKKPMRPGVGEEKKQKGVCGKYAKECGHKQKKRKRTLRETEKT